MSWLAELPSDDPRLAIARRARGRIEFLRLELHQDVLPELRDIASRAVDRLRASQSRPYHPFAHLELGEQHFEMGVEEHPQLSGADLLAALAAVDQLSVLPADELQRTPAILAYAIVWPIGDDFIGFVKKSDPAKFLRSGFRYFQYGDVLRRVEEPNFVLAPTIDVIATKFKLASFANTTLKDVLSDVGVVFSEVRSEVVQIQGILSGTLPLSGESAEALVSLGESKVSIARRLAQLRTRLDLIERDPKKLRKYMKEYGSDHTLFINAKGELIFGGDNVEEFLDFVEGRLFQDPLAGEQRRADRFSARKRPLTKP